MMFEFINEPVSVEIQFRRDGTVRPMAFSWRGRRYRIESWGRENADTRDRPTLHCYLVQTEGFESWELCQNTETAHWTLVRHWTGKYRAV
jgi:hypothetical protein